MRFIRSNMKNRHTLHFYILIIAVIAPAVNSKDPFLRYGYVTCVLLHACSSLAHFSPEWPRRGLLPGNKRSFPSPFSDMPLYFPYYLFSSMKKRLQFRHSCDIVSLLRVVGFRLSGSFPLFIIAILQFLIF